LTCTRGIRSAAPERERVARHDVAAQLVPRPVGAIHRRVELPALAGRPCDAEGGGVVLPALEVDLCAPAWVEVPGEAQHRLVVRARAQHARDELGVVHVPACFQEGLRRIALRRPAQEAGAQQERLVAQQSELRRGELLVGREALEGRDLGPIREPQLGLRLPGIADRTILRLRAQRQLPRGLQVRGDDLAQSLGGRERRCRRERRCHQ